MNETDVIVAGGGVVGLTAALGLARAGVSVTVYESRTSVPVGTSDLVYLWPVLPGFGRLGVLDDLLRAGITSPRWGYVVPPTGEQLVWDLGVLSDEVEHPVNLTVARETIVELLTAALRAQPGARIETGVAVEDLDQDAGGVTVALAGPDGPARDRAAWVVGADGAGSRVRRALGLGLVGHTWAERLVSTTIGYDLAELGALLFQARIASEHPAVTQLIDDGRDGGARRWRFAYAESRVLTEDTVPERMHGVFRAVLPADADADVRAWAAYRMHERVADTFRVGRVLLIGDAAHLTNPTSALGMSGGLFDAFGLVDALPPVVVDGAADTRLDSFAERRREIFRHQVSPASTRNKELVFHSADPLVREQRLAGLREVFADRDSMRAELVRQSLLASELVPVPR